MLDEEIEDEYENSKIDINREERDGEKTWG